MHRDILQYQIFKNFTALFNSVIVNWSIVHILLTNFLSWKMLLLTIYCGNITLWGLRVTHRPLSQLLLFTNISISSMNFLLLDFSWSSIVGVLETFAGHTLCKSPLTCSHSVSTKYTYPYEETRIFSCQKLRNGAGN